MKQYESGIYSQWGEEGVLTEIFKRIGVKNRTLCDVGAWDGVHLSNTAKFREEGWHCILAEADPDRLQDLHRLKTETVAVHGYVTNIDAMLDFFEAPADLDLLCIDVDGDDYYLWEDMIRYRPRVVVIEYNQTVPPHISMVQHRGGSFGASYEALCELGANKGYGLTHVTTTNMIFVWLDDWEKLTPLIGRKTPDMPDDWIQFIVTGYNGKKYLVGPDAHNDNQGGQHEELITDVKYKPV